MNGAVIVACGGLGLRFRGDTEKQFTLLEGKPVLAHTLDVPERHPRIDIVVLVLPAGQTDKGKALVEGLWPSGHSRCYYKVIAVLAGGEDRQSSVSIGIAALQDCGWRGPVLVQDGVRPCTPSQVYDRVLDGVLTKGNAVAAIRIRDTIKRADGNGLVLDTIDRQGLWQIQTPQGFWMHELQEAYAEGKRRDLHVTDDAALVEALGRQVHLVEGHPANMKLTYPEDMALMEALLAKGMI